MLLFTDVFTTLQQWTDGHDFLSPLNTHYKVVLSWRASVAEQPAPLPPLRLASPPVPSARHGHRALWPFAEYLTTNYYVILTTIADRINVTSFLILT